MFIAAEAMAVTKLFQFRIDSEYLEQVQYPQTTIGWVTKDVSPAVWIVMVLVLALAVNLLPVRQFGLLQTVYGRIKLWFLVALILANAILNARQKFHEERFWTWNSPWNFKTNEFVAKAPIPGDPNLQGIVYQGSLATLTSLWTAIFTAFPSVIGWDIMMLAAPEDRKWQVGETLGISSRKTSIRISILYILAVFTVGLNVPYTDEGLTTTSIFVLSAVREHVPVLPHILNGFFLISATVAAANYLYVASRLLYSISNKLCSTCKNKWTSHIHALG